eukprot:TRINITY_DN6121_c0_g5_i6.p1 TRINITY_DN6121_c0_g5~~TRINITY_DN6121_c0_g5_i6.p1  ORF type:complete len:1552 (+),score=385.61 TRINITY_DN6121_c0_g5_i6:358-5013(+)
MVNEKFRENAIAWACFEKKEEMFGLLFKRVLDLYFDEKMSLGFKFHYVRFISNCFQSLYHPMLRRQCERLVSLKLWDSVSEGRREEVYQRWPKLRQLRNHLDTKKRPRDEEIVIASYDKTFFPSLLTDYFKILNSEEVLSDEAIKYCCFFVEFITDLISQLSTRRVFHLLLEDSHFLVRSRRAPLIRLPQGSLFKQLLGNLRFYYGFEINNFTGQALSDDDMSKEHYSKLKRLQHVAFKKFQPELRRFALSNIGAVNTRESLKAHLSELKDDKLVRLCESINLINKTQQYERSFLLELMISHHQKRLSQLEILNAEPLYPNEELLWDENQIPTENFSGETCLALPKLNLQFLTFHDYFLRNLTLFRLESTYEIRLDLENTIKRVKPVATSRGTEFKGWARMALEIDNFKVTHVSPPKIGYTVPASVAAEISFTLPSRKSHTMDLKKEWDELREHDVVFLAAVRPPVQNTEIQTEGRMGVERETVGNRFREQFGVVYIRGCEVGSLIDEDGGVISDPNPEKRPRIPSGNKRTLRVWLDAAQYQIDLDRKQKKKHLNAPVEEENKEGDGEDVYSCLNLLIRRRAKENNFKAVLETIRDLMNAQEELKVPNWLKDVFLGYGDPKKCQNVNAISEVNFVDTFVSIEHLKSSFPGREFLSLARDHELVPPFKISFPHHQDQPLRVTPYTRLNQGPYPQNIPKTNTVPFTPVQVRCIRQAMNDGLTMIVGPPGTGKTDVAVQIVSNWYHNFPTQHTLIVTHSNQALNQIFEKIIHLDVDERHLLRLGHGERDLETDSDFSKLGRVDWMLNLRLENLKQVRELAISLGLEEEVAVTCETAENFFIYEILSRWEKFLADLQEARESMKVCSVKEYRKKMLKKKKEEREKQQMKEEIEKENEKNMLPQDQWMQQDHQHHHDQQYQDQQKQDQQKQDQQKQDQQKQDQQKQDQQKQDQQKQDQQKQDQQKQDQQKQDQQKQDQQKQDQQKQDQQKQDQQKQDPQKQDQQKQDQQQDQRSEQKQGQQQDQQCQQDHREDQQQEDYKNKRKQKDQYQQKQMGDENNRQKEETKENQENDEKKNAKFEILDQQKLVMDVDKNLGEEEEKEGKRDEVKCLMDVEKTDPPSKKDSKKHDSEKDKERMAEWVDEEEEFNLISELFPFGMFFSDVQPLFSGGSLESDLEIAEGCWRHITRIFDQLKDCRAFELLKSSYDRGNYLLMKQAKIIAMTCTHAALKRHELYKLGFKFDNLLMEEAAQILEIETFIPMVLQNQDPEAPPRLKRIVLIGDHNQLPPVVKNMAFQKYGHLDQSLFTRFIRLGVPPIQLDAQGRTRPSISKLYKWRYPKLLDLPHVIESPAYHLANPGFLYEYQLVNVEDYNGKGETTPNPYFFQNLGEAEFVVATFMYMRMLGYPAEKITILTSYNGQKHLLRDVVERRCGLNPSFGRPKKITTVDRYQGQQNDYVLLSLVRTVTVGHIRDIRRLVVAMSRARLGLYIFCRKSLFLNCYELMETFSQLVIRPDKLQLVQHETYPTQRKVDDTKGCEVFQVEDLYHMAKITHNQAV